MSIETVQLIVPPEIAKGLASGQLVRRGSIVVAKGTGKVFAHLLEATSMGERASDLVQTTAQRTSPRTRAAIIAGATVVGTAVVTTVAARQRKAKNLEQQLNRALTAYITAGRNLELTGDIITHVIEALDAVHAANPALTVTDLGLDQISAAISTHTSRLAAANPARTPTIAIPDGTESITELHDSLTIQHAILSPDPELPS